MASLTGGGVANRGAPFRRSLPVFASPHLPIARSTTARMREASNRSVPTIVRTDGLKQVIDAFQTTAGLRFLPVLDDRDAPVGAIYEADIRRLLFNRFGHDLLANPGISSRIDDYLAPCPARDIATPLDMVLREFSGDAGFEGLILTEGGRFHGILSNRAMLRLAADAEAERSAGRDLRIQHIEAATSGFRHIAEAATGDLANASSELATLAAAFLQSAKGNDERGRDMASAAREASRVLQSIALQAASLASAGEQVRAQTMATNEAAAIALRYSEEGSDRAAALSATSSEIGGVVDLIQTISSQVRLLSLNARIEAARAGAAGATFGVVADEIRQLAEQTQRAAATIAARTGAVDAAVDEALSNHGAMRDAIAVVARATAEIELAMTEQSRSTHAIADHVRSADGRAREVTAGIDLMRSDSATMIARTDRVDAMARSISGSAQDIRRTVDGFLGELAAA